MDEVKRNELIVALMKGHLRAREDGKVEVYDEYGTKLALVVDQETYNAVKSL